MLLAGKGTFDTLYRAIGFGTASSLLEAKEHQLALLVASFQGNVGLAQALMEPSHMTAPIHKLGACAVQRGWISRVQITPTLVGDGDPNPSNCELSMFRAMYPIHLDATGKTAFHLYQKNQSPVDYKVPTVGPLAPPVAQLDLEDEDEVHNSLEWYMDDFYIPNRTPGSTPQSMIDDSNEHGLPPAI
ncbi:hypothetical protein H4R33_003744 [Dimargaris cristalligena]|nr:hypothetical protein H4R33_003744 [Dimargaris cristalligena]